MTIANQRIRLAIDTSQMGNINDVITGATPQFWNGVDLQFELAIFYGAALSDISNLDSITIDLKESDPRTGLPLMSATIPSNQLNESLTLSAWQGGAVADCHALIAFTNEQTNLELSDDTVTFWLVISALTNDAPAHRLVLGATPLNVTEGGEGVTPPASVVEPAYYTAAQSDARFQRTVDLTSINSQLSTLNTEMTAVTTTANRALPLTGGTVTGPVTLSGLSGVLKANTGIVAGSSTTSDMPEGTNLYWTQARFNSAIAAIAGADNGVCPLDAGGLVPAANLPSITVHDTFVVSSQAAMLALSAHQGDVAIRTDVNETFILVSGSPTTLSNWAQLLTPASAVTSVNSLTGAVTLTSSNVAEGSNLYYTAARAQGDALAAALTGFSTATGGDVTSADSVLSALGKLENRMEVSDAKSDGSNRVLRAGDTMTGNLAFSGGSTAGVVLSNLTDTQRAALAASTGMIIYDSTLAQVFFYNGSWIPLSTGGGQTWYAQAGAPTAGTGSNGDFALDTNTGNIYQLSSGTWSIIFSPAVSGFVPLAGGTMSGLLQFSGNGNPGLKLNNLDTTHQNLLTGSAGMLLYNTTLETPGYYNGSAWIPLNVRYNTATGQLEYNSGSGFTAIGSATPNAPITKSSNYTMAATDSYVLTNGGALTITLPTSPVLGQIYYVKNISISNITLSTGSSAQIDTQASLTVTSLTGYGVIYDGTNWWVVSKGVV